MDFIIWVLNLPFWVVALALVVMVIVSLVWHIATARSGYYERER